MTVAELRSNRSHEPGERHRAGPRPLTKRFAFTVLRLARAIACVSAGSGPVLVEEEVAQVMVTEPDSELV